MKRRTYHYIANTAKEAAKSLLTGFLSLLWVILLLIAETAVRAAEMAVRAIRSKPCVAVAITFIAMLAVAVANHAQMKVRLTTTEYQRDSLQHRLDTANMKYYRYRSYNPNRPIMPNKPIRPKPSE